MTDTKYNTEADCVGALGQLEDLLDRALLVPSDWCVLGEAAKKLRNHENFEGLDKIEVAIPERKMNKFVEGVFKTIAGENWAEQEYRGIPLKIKIIKGKFKFFDHIDLQPLVGASYGIPNPFNEYWKVRGIVA